MAVVIRKLPLTGEYFTEGSKTTELIIEWLTSNLVGHVMFLMDPTSK